MHPAASVSRPAFRTCTATVNPFPTEPSTWSSGNLEILVEQLRLCRSTNAELSDRAEDFEARHVGAKDECSRAHHGLTAPLDWRLREGRDHASAMRVADPDLVTVEHPLRAVFGKSRGRLDVLRVGASLGLRQRIGRERLTAREAREIARLLLVVSV